MMGHYEYWCALEPAPTLSIFQVDVNRIEKRHLQGIWDPWQFQILVDLIADADLRILYLWLIKMVYHFCLWSRSTFVVHIYIYNHCFLTSRCLWLFILILSFMNIWYVLCHTVGDMIELNFRQLFVGCVLWGSGDIIIYYILFKSLMMGYAQFAWPTVFYWAGDNNSITWSLSWFTGDRMKNWLAISCWVRPSRNWIFLHCNIQWNHDISQTQNTPEMFKRFPDLPCDCRTVPSQLTSVYWSYMLGCPPNQQKRPTSLVGDFNKQ